MRKIIINGEYMTDKQTLHTYLKTKLKIEGYFGNNLDSLWDALNCCDQKLKIYLINEELLIENLNENEKTLIKVFKDASVENKNIYFEIIETD